MVSKNVRCLVFMHKNIGVEPLGTDKIWPGPHPGGLGQNQRSPIHRVNSDDAPFLILHGDQDPLVPFQQSERLEQALRKAGVECKLHLLPGAGHGGAAFDSAATRQEILSFLRRRNSQ